MTKAKAAWYLDDIALRGRLMANVACQPMSVEEFLVWQLAQEDRYELVEGIPVKMMAGASNFHDVIAP